VRREDEFKGRPPKIMGIQPAMNRLTAAAREIPTEL